MNEIIKNLGTVCIIAYVTGIVANISGSTQVKKTVSLILALYILLAVLAPATKQKITFDYNLSEYVPTQVTSERDEYVLQAAKENLELFIKEKLSEKNISYTALSVHINKQDEKISVDSVSIYGLRSRDIQVAKEIISSVLPDSRLITGDEK